MTSIAESVGQLEGVKLYQPSPSLRRRNRIKTIQSSLSIEGNSLTREQVTALLDNKRVIGPQKDVVAVRNAIEVYARLASFDPVSLVSFLDAHRMVMAGLVGTAGSLRKTPIGVVREGDIFHEAPEWEHVASLMQALFDYLKASDDHVLLKSSRFHYQLEYIHPFEDGNGRMGRLWQTRLLMEYHPIFEFLPVEEQIRARQGDYYRELAIGDDSGDCTGFVGFMLELILESLRGLLIDTRSVTLRAPNRLEMALAHFENATFSRKDYQAFFKTISTATASRDLQYGVKRGLLVKSGDKRTAVYRYKN